EGTDEIALVSLVNLFPLRFARVVRGLKERYDARLAEGRDRATLEVHTEGDGSQFPDLFVPDRAQVGARLRPALLVGLALGAISSSRNEATGRDQLVMVRKDADGFDLAPLVLGASLGAAGESLGEADAFAIQEVNEAALAKGALVSDESRTGARDAIMAAIEP